MPEFWRLANRQFCRLGSQILGKRITLPIQKFAILFACYPWIFRIDAPSQGMKSSAITCLVDFRNRRLHIGNTTRPIFRVKRILPAAGIPPLTKMQNIESAALDNINPIVYRIHAYIRIQIRSPGSIALKCPRATCGGMRSARNYSHRFKRIAHLCPRRADYAETLTLSGIGIKSYL